MVKAESHAGGLRSHVRYDACTQFTPSLLSYFTATPAQLTNAMANDRAIALKTQIRDAAQGQQQLRPIFTSLNGDNSWLLSFPRPTEERIAGGKAFFHIVHDPWFNGPVNLLGIWLASFSLSSPPAVNNGSDVEGIARDVEAAAADAGILPTTAPITQDASPIDAIFIRFHYNDHLHKPTLLTFASSIPVFATTGASAIIRGWNHFDNIITTSDLEPGIFNGDWTSLHPGSPLPTWLTVFRARGHHELNFASAIIYTPSPDVHEAVLYSPHGMRTSQESLQTLLHRSAPEFKVLALLHGLKESWTFNWQTTFGVATGLELQRQTDAKYWIATHNSPLRYRGLLWAIVTDVSRTLEWALGKEKASDSEQKEVNVVDVENGGFFVLK
ncbi:uncharacterized protein J4E84_009535 [Alternaria hordeiaustralica]|uniref:uncharacterized protein n=1 Tax=Alternaria hordeiaustralica TaxID=1187925 RepID=UPI0020C4A9F7|nr:uncharacterized protein J4E84_009535 [Alternaria hordeiaustralica]KAI4676700.1 hypothetical protein J4E84_009535 [Alternaria hordeiaustralica]